MTAAEAKKNRQRLALSRKGLARRMNLSEKGGHVTVAQWENGDRNMSDMSAEFLRTLVMYESIDVATMKNK